VYAAVIERPGEGVVRGQFGVEIARHDVDVDRIDIARDRQIRVAAHRAEVARLGLGGFIDRIELAFDAFADGIPQQFLRGAADDVGAAIKKAALHQLARLAHRFGLAAMFGHERGACSLLINRAHAGKQLRGERLAQGRDEGIARGFVVGFAGEQCVAFLEHGPLLKQAWQGRRPRPRR
jgi:hypothetical protein